MSRYIATGCEHTRDFLRVITDKDNEIERLERINNDLQRVTDDIKRFMRDVHPLITEHKANNITITSVTPDRRWAASVEIDIGSIASNEYKVIERAIDRLKLKYWRGILDEASKLFSGKRVIDEYDYNLNILQISEAWIGEKPKVWRKW